MFNFFKKEKNKESNQETSFELELTAAVLAYEIARSDGEISNDELSILMQEIEKISQKVGKNNKFYYRYSKKKCRPDFIGSRFNYSLISPDQVQLKNCNIKNKTGNIAIYPNEKANPET